MNKLIIISAPSGAGKTTIVKEVMQKTSLNLMFSISATSRQPRDYEINGKDYYFLSVDDFKEKIKQNQFVEWEEVYENQFYGTLNSEVERIWALNKNIIFDVDVKGGINIKKAHPENSLSIFIKPPSVEELKNRLQNRGTETEASLQKRIDKAKYEMTFAPQFDITITNDKLDIAVQNTISAISKFINKTDNMLPDIENPTWKKIISGENKHKFSNYILQIQVYKLQQDYRLKRITDEVAIKNLYNICKKYYAVVKKDLNKIFN